ncbi:hypothetical protein [Sphingomonas sp. S2-65]|uniref:hypothetical protein n=1 Tax=Sphingomonas sp. S2-65 TaxID=2903960 RepID=UPI001F3D289B|nr:hypothetical protein [Sphingomonas sp. S2-65]UYY59931.1 hypothetical protein LZ586_07560 [Sphingomonas sp. S2-65]
MADRRNWLGGVSVALALCAALPAAAQDRRVFSAASDDPAPERAGAPEDYAWIDRADALWDAIGDSPPDFAFTFEDVEPWAWQLRDGHVILVEEAAEGIRSYYFEPRSNVPFLAVEPGASFAFEDGELVIAYGPDGTALGEVDGMARYEQGMALFDRARQLKQAMRPQSAQPVDTGAWLESSLYLGGFLDQWHQGFAARPEWRAQRDTAAARDWRYRLQAERSRRQALGQGFRRWREGGFQGPPPARWRRPGDVRPGQPPRQGVRPRPDRPEAGGPDRPRPPGRPGSRPEPQVPALPPVLSAPRPNRPDRPDRPVVQPGPTPGTPNVARPPRPWGTPRPGWNRPRPVPQPGAAPEPGSSGVVPGRPPRPQGRPGWMQRPPIASPAPAGSGEAGRPVRPERRPGWSRRPPISTPAPSKPSGVTQPAPVRPDRPAPQSRPPEAAPVSPPPPRVVPEARPSRPLRPGVRVPNDD